MATRMTQEMGELLDGRQQVLVRIPLDHPLGSDGTIEVTALVSVPTIDSDAQIEVAAREMARQALQRALAQFP